MFKELFNEFKLTKKYIKKDDNGKEYFEVPFDIFVPEGIEKLISYKLTETGNKIDIVVNLDIEDMLYIPLLPYSKNLEYDLASLLIYTATDRNIMVYDSQDESNILTPKLISLMSKTLRRNSGGSDRIRLTDIFINEYESVGLDIHGVKIHEVPDEMWSKLESYFLNNLQGSLAHNDTNLVLGVSADQNNDFIIGKIGDLEGMGVISNKRLILGSF